MNDKKGGTTLIELIVAMGLIAIVAITSLEFIAQYQRLAVHPALQIGAANFASGTMENIYMNGILPWNTVTSTPGWAAGTIAPPQALPAGWTCNSTGAPSAGTDYTIIDVNVTSP